MENDDDFTFCQVGRPVDQGNLEAKNLVPDVGAISIKDDKLDANGGKQNNGFLWKDKFPNKDTSKKQDLSFTVTDASSREPSSDLSRQVLLGDAGSSIKNAERPKLSVRKPTPRAKVPFEKGYSQMDWLKLTQTHPDLAGLKGQSNRRLISMEEVKKHQKEDCMWTVLKGRVYNLSPYMKFHPGGVDMLMKVVGKDSTSLFNKYHAWVNAEFLLEKCLVGMLDDSR